MKTKEFNFISDEKIYSKYEYSAYTLGLDDWIY
jgi:hypothetical protein